MRLRLPTNYFVINSTGIAATAKHATEEKRTRYLIIFYKQTSLNASMYTPTCVLTPYKLVHCVVLYVCNQRDVLLRYPGHRLGKAVGHWPRTVEAEAAGGTLEVVAA